MEDTEILDDSGAEVLGFYISGMLGEPVMKFTCLCGEELTIGLLVEETCFGTEDDGKLCRRVWKMEQNPITNGIALRVVRVDE